MAFLRSLFFSFPSWQCRRALVVRTSNVQRAHPTRAYTYSYHTLIRTPHRHTHTTHAHVGESGPAASHLLFCKPTLSLPWLTLRAVVLGATTLSPSVMGVVCAGRQMQLPAASRLGSAARATRRQASQLEMQTTATIFGFSSQSSRPSPFLWQRGGIAANGCGQQPRHPKEWGASHSCHSRLPFGVVHADPQGRFPHAGKVLRDLLPFLGRVRHT